jgi:putative DNA primase/helicase
MTLSESTPLRNDNAKDRQVDNKHPNAIARKFFEREVPDLIYYEPDKVYYSRNDLGLYASVSNDELEDRFLLWSERDEIMVRTGKGLERLIPTGNLTRDALRSLRGMVPHADRDPCSIDPEVVIDSRHEIVVQNGVLDMRSGELRSSRGVFARRCVGVDYDPDADAPLIDDVLRRMLRDDDEQILAWWQWCGYVLTQRTDLQQIMMLVGEPGAGKSTVIAATIDRFLGDAIHHMDLDEFGGRFAMDSLYDRHVCCIDEGKITLRSNEQGILSKMLRISGGDRMFVEGKHVRKGWSLHSALRLMINTNQPPAFRDPSFALGRRLVALQVSDAAFDRTKADLSIGDKLKAEAPGILNRIIAGYQSIEPCGIRQPAGSASIVEDLRRAASPLTAALSEFFDDEIEVGASSDAELCGVAAVYQRYDVWATMRGVREIPTEAVFSRELLKLLRKRSIDCSTARRDGNRYRVYQGVRLRPLVMRPHHDRMTG